MAESLELSPLEADLIGDLAQDDHALHEVFEFVRLHYPDLDTPSVVKLGRELLATWLARGWLALSLQDGPPPSVMRLDELLPFVDAQGLSVVRATSEEPWLCLSGQAFADVAWLRSE